MTSRLTVSVVSVLAVATIGALASCTDVPSDREGTDVERGSEVFGREPGASEARSDFDVHPSTQEPERLVTVDHLVRWEDELSNWGRWGPDDQRGTLNYISPEKARASARLVREGITVSLQHFVTGEKAVDSQVFGETRHWMSRVSPDGTVTAALDEIAFSLHDGQLSHMDALCHYWGAERSPARRFDDAERIVYNGYPQNLDQEGCRDLAIDRMGPGYVTRGVLVDMPVLRGVEWLEPSTPIYPDDLQAWEEFAGVEVQPGDVLLVRTGRWAKREAEGPWNYARGGAGLHASTLPWLHERGVALLVGDAVNDVQPSGVDGINRPVHQMTQVVLGLPLVDNGYLEDVAEVAEELGRWEFQVSWLINQVENGTASPFNGLATF